MPEKPEKEEKIFTGRKQWKALAKSVVRKHYLLLLLLCLLSMFYGTEFGYIPNSVP